MVGRTEQLESRVQDLMLEKNKSTEHVEEW